ncbi:MAG: PEGA domain-containing protein, partial [Pseudomonadota bacterium]
MRIRFKTFGTQILLCSIAWYFGISSAEAKRESSKPIVAVFDVQFEGVNLSPGMQGRLSDYLAMRLADTGNYLVVPRDRMKERLATEKKNSYKSCFDQSCQIEIGKEMSAQKSLSTTVAKLGSRCMVTSVMYDLRKSTSEGGASVDGKCSEDDIVQSIQRIVLKLAPMAMASAVYSPPETTPEPPVEVESEPPPPPFPTLDPNMVPVEFDSEPRYARVSINGEDKGETYLSINLNKNETYDVVISKDKYLPVTKRINPEKEKQVYVELPPTPWLQEWRRTRTEWFGLVLPEIFVGAHDWAAFGLGIRLFTVKWEYVYWTILEGGVAAGTYESSFVGHAGSTVGANFLLGS